MEICVNDGHQTDSVSTQERSSGNLILSVVPLGFSREASSKYLNKTPISHMHISVSEFLIPICCRASGCPTLHM